MDLREEFIRAWTGKFPEEAVPVLTCFVDCDTGQVDRLPTESKLQQALETATKQVLRLQTELDKQEFVAGFLWNLIYPAKCPPWKVGHVGSENMNHGSYYVSLSSGPSSACDGYKREDPTIRGHFESAASKTQPLSDLDVVVPVYDSVPRGEDGLMYKNISDDKVTEHHKTTPSSLPVSLTARGQARKPSTESVQSYADLGHTVTSFTGSRGSVNSGDSHGSIVGPVERDRTASLPGGIKRPTSGNKGVTHTRNSSTYHAGVRNELRRTDSEKAQDRIPLQKSASLDYSNNNNVKPDGFFSLEKRGTYKAPVPSPRPSLKGPTLRTNHPKLSVTSISSFDEGSSPGIARNLSTKSERSSFNSHRPKVSEKPCVHVKPTTMQETVKPGGVSVAGSRDRDQTFLLKSNDNMRTSPHMDHQIAQGPFCDTVSMVSSDLGVDIASLGSRLSTISATDEEKLESLQKGNNQGGLMFDVDSARGSLCEESTYDNRLLGHQTLDAVVGVFPPGANRSIPEDPDYDDPMPVNKELVEESSSEDDEPIYYNMLLMRQQTLNRMKGQQLYASSDLEKKHLHQQAKRLSQKLLLLRDSADGSLGRTFAVSSEEDIPHSADPGEVFDGPHSFSQKDAGQTFVFTGPHGQDGAGSAAWQRRSSMKRALTDTSTDSEPELEMFGSLPPVIPDTNLDAEKKLQMRKSLISALLKSEHAYVEKLGVLLQYMRSLEAVATTTQPVITREDAQVIFMGIPELHKIHSCFIHDLEAKFKTWSNTQEIGEIVKIMAISEYPVLQKFTQNLKTATDTIKKCSQENIQFANISEMIKIQGNNATLEGILQQIAHRIPTNSFMLNDLINSTPTSHADYDALRKTQKMTHHFLDILVKPLVPEREVLHYLVKNGLMVQLVKSERKLRHVFLFNEILVATKQKLGSRKIHFEVKWSVPLAELEVDIKNTAEEEKNLKKQISPRIADMKQKIRKLQAELRQEVRACKENAQMNKKKSSRNVLKIEKKLMEHQTALLKASPVLMMKLINTKNHKTHVMMINSDYERNEWEEAILGLKGKVSGTESLNGVDIQNLVNSVELPEVETMSSQMTKDDMGLQERMFGILNVNIHRVQGIKTRCDVFCTVEVDTYERFELKAKTNIISQTTEPIWNEDFDVDLDGAQTCRILCYKQDGANNVLLGRCALELSKAWLRGDFQEKSVYLNEELNLVVSLRYTSQAMTIKRTPSTAKAGYFGIKIASVCRREHAQVPLLISTCIEEVEKRGLDQEGIYRVSGVTTQINTLKRAFEKNARGAVNHVKDAEINVVTGLLKLYLRELPEPLVTDRLYPQILRGLEISEPEAHKHYIFSLLRCLEEPNLSTIRYILQHIVRVVKAKHLNKMDHRNMATVFAPTLLGRAFHDKDATLESVMARQMEIEQQIRIMTKVFQAADEGWEI